jgi:beta-glucosidase/6-phospho-beta-glucosidase/beta-galactosidase
MHALTQHDSHLSLDYSLLNSFNIFTARDGVNWPFVEQAGSFDFSPALRMINAANEQNIQVIWNIFHYGYPDDIDIFSPSFVDRFACYCSNLSRFIHNHTDQTPFYTPINEISFLSWAAGEVGYIHPYEYEKGHLLKRQLVRAAIAGIEAIWAVNPAARIVQVEPLIHIVYPRDSPHLAQAAAEQRANQFDAWDMMSGLIDPDLGGHPRYLDIMGFNYYHSNQWECTGQHLRWDDDPRDDRWVPLHKLIIELYERYRRPLFAGETSHFGVGRGPWLREIADEFKKAINYGIPLEGLTLYPIIDRPDWDNIEHWHNSGLWDLVPDEQGTLQRVLNQPYATVVNEIIENMRIGSP